MQIESFLEQTLKPIALGSVWWDTPPQHVQFPCIVCQHIGGQVITTLENTRPSHRHARIQVVVWAKQRIEANTIMYTIADTLRTIPLPTETYGGLTALYDDTVALRGARQDFGIWYPVDG